MGSGTLKAGIEEILDSKNQCGIATVLQERTLPEGIGNMKESIMKVVLLDSIDIRKQQESSKFSNNLLLSLLYESSIMKLATSPCSKIFVSLSLSKPVISFDNRLEAVRLSCQG